jgi:hypothetical protein
MATTSIGSRNQYSTSVSGGTVVNDLFPRDVPDWVDKLQRTDVVVQKHIGSEGAPSRSMHKAEWGWGSPDPYSDTITEAALAGDLTLTVANGEYYQVNDVIAIDEEEIRVTAVAGDVLTVERAFAGTTAAAHSDNAVVIILGPATVESADDPDSPFTMGQVEFNYHQIMTFTWAMSERAEQTWNYENQGGNSFSKELKKKMDMTAPIRFELRLLRGHRAQGTGSSPSAFGALRQSSYITTRIDMSDAILTETDLMSNLQTVHNLVGSDLMPDTLICSPLTARIISSWYNHTRQSTMDSTKAGVKWTSIETWFGPIKVVPHYLMSTVDNDRLYVADWGRIKKRPYASSTGWQTGEHNTQGWHRRGYLRGDYTVLFPYADARLEIFNYSTTAADYSGLS